MGKLVSFRKKANQSSAQKALKRALPTFIGTDEQLVRKRKPAKPLQIIKPAVIEETARNFIAAFPGKVLYAVKTNPHESVIAAVAKGGIAAFDVASIEEVRLVRANAPKAEMYFMHPIKSPEAIREAYYRYGVRHFVLDCEDELYKIIRETGLATDLKLHVRLALPKNSGATIDFSCKFGAVPMEAAALLRKCRTVSETLGLSFHVGTQISDASVFAQALKLARNVIDESRVKVDVLDVGGGFPVHYTGENVPTIAACMDVIRKGVREAGLGHMDLMAEPGRALVAEGGALAARVELRKGNLLYLNDGTYGGLFDAGPLLGTRYPVRAVRGEGVFEGGTMDYRLAGPTCDSLDMMEGPFTLPADIRMGDWIVFENTGAYSQTMRTAFNGFGRCDTVLLV